MSSSHSSLHQMGLIQTYPYPRKERQPLGNESHLQKYVNRGLRKIEKPFKQYAARRIVKVISEQNSFYSLFDDEYLLNRAGEFRQENLGHPLKLLSAAKGIALVQQLAFRHLKLDYTKEQWRVAWIMLRGDLASVDRGVGKTEAVGLAAIVGALFGRTVHVYSLNESLAESFHNNFKPLYELLGITATHQRDNWCREERRAAYRSTIVHGTLKQFVSDYLADLQKLGLKNGPLRQKMTLFCHANAVCHLQLPGLQYALIDDADVLLSDEAARSIALFSKRNYLDEEAFAYEALLIAKRLEQDRDFILNRHENSIEFTDEGREYVRSLAIERGGLWYAEGRCSLAVNRALCAIHLYHNGEHYLVQGGAIFPQDPALKSQIETDGLTPKFRLLLKIKEDGELVENRYIVDRIFGKKVLASYLHLGGILNRAPELRGEFEQTYEISMLNVNLPRPQSHPRIVTVVYQNAINWARTIAVRANSLTAQRQSLVIVTRSEKLTLLLEEALSLCGLTFRELPLSQPGFQPGTQVAPEEERTKLRSENIIIIKGLIEKDPRLYGEVKDLSGVIILAERQASMRIERQIYHQFGHQSEGQMQIENHWTWEDPILEHESGHFGIARYCAHLFPWGQQCLGKWILAIGMKKQEQYLSSLRQSIGKHDQFLKQTFAFTERVE